MLAVLACIALSVVTAMPPAVPKGMLDGIAAGLDHLQASKKHNQLLDAQLEQVKLESAQLKFSEQYKAQKMVSPEVYEAKMAEMNQQLKKIEQVIADLTPKDEKSKKLEAQVVAAAAKRAKDEAAISSAAPVANTGAKTVVAPLASANTTNIVPSTPPSTVIGQTIVSSAQVSSTVPATPASALPATAPLNLGTPVLAYGTSNPYATRADTQKLMLLQQTGLNQ